MIQLSAQQVKEILEQRTNYGVSSASNYQSYLRLLTESKDLHELRSESSWSSFLRLFDITSEEKKDRLIESIKYPLSCVSIADKAAGEINKIDRLIESIKYPLSCVSIADKAAGEINKIFDAQNSSFTIDSDDKSKREKGNQLASNLDAYSFIKEKTIKTLINSPCSIVYLDYPEEGGEPYAVYLPIENVLNLKVKKESAEINWIFFHDGTENYYYLFDATTRRKYSYNEGKYTLIDELPQPYISNPARFFLSERLNTESEIKRKGIFGANLGDLKAYQFNKICNDWSELTSMYPVIQRPQPECGKCDGAGFITIEVEGGEDRYEKCDCLKNVTLSGSVINIPKQFEGDITPAGVYDYILPDVSNLQFNSENLEKQKEDIYYTSVGVTTQVNKNQINEKQVDQNYQSRKIVLLGIKSQLDELYKWIVNTALKYEFGDVEFRISADFGTDYYLESITEIQTIFKNAKENGTPEAEIDQIYNQVITTKYKGNNAKIERMLLLNEIDPLPYYTYEQSKERLENGTISREDYIIHASFSSLIKRFERENGNIIFYNEGMTLSAKIDSIVKILKSYIDDSKQQGTGNGDIANAQS